MGSGMIPYSGDWAYSWDGVFNYLCAFDSSGVEENISDCQELGIVKGRGMAWLSISSTREIFLVME